MNIIRTTKIKLKANPEVFENTFKAVTDAFNYICKIGFEDKDYNSISLHHKTYQYCRKEFNLPSELAIQTRMKAAEALKPSLKKNRLPQSKRLSVRLTKNSYNIWFDRGECSILTVDGRKKFQFYMPEYFKQYVSWRRKSAELIQRGNNIYLNIIWEKDVEDIQTSNNPKIIGIDRGINKVAVCSDNRFFNGNIIRVATRYQKLRKALMKCGSKSAKRHLKKIRGKENRFRKDVNHRISKEIVATVGSGDIIVLEDLKHIRKRSKTSKDVRRKLHNWSFYQLEQFIRYKAEAKNVKVDYVDARYTSQKCSKCGHIEKGNRKSQPVFKCKHCGFSLNADLNAARNIELNYRDAKGYPEGLSVNQPIVGG